MKLLGQDTLNAIRNDSLKWGTMFAVVRLLEMKSVTDMNWVRNSIFVLIGFATYHLTFGNFLDTNEFLSGKIQESADIALKFGTMLIVANLFAGNDLNKERLTTVGWEVAGYVAAGFFLKDLVKQSNLQGLPKLMLTDAIFFGGHAVFLQLMDKRSITDKQFLKDLAFLLTGFSAYNAFIR